VLAFVALMGLKPWQSDSVEPRLTLPFEAAVGDAVALPPASYASVAPNVVAPAGPKLAGAATGPEGEGRPVLAVAPAQAVAVAETPVTAPVATEPETEPVGAGEETPSAGATDGEAPSDGVSSPVSAPVSDPGKGPVTAGGPTIESCDGDEYVISVVLVPGEDEGEEADGSEEASVEIVLQRFNEDGSVDELRLEGDLLDARNLAVQLSLEGNCVYLEAGAVTEKEVPSDGTSQAVVPSEGTSFSALDPAAEDPGADALAEPESP